MILINKPNSLPLLFQLKLTNHLITTALFILGLSQATAGELSNIVYAYDGRVRIHTQKLDTNIEVKLTLSPDWHINSNQPLQDALIATEITNLDTQHWTIKSINYPKAELAKLAFSEEKISIYKKSNKD